MFELVDPFFRLVSVYYNKFSKKNEKYKKMSKEIIKLYRFEQINVAGNINCKRFQRVDRDVGDKDDTPTPTEFIKFDTPQLLIALSSFA